MAQPKESAPRLHRSPQSFWVAMVQANKALSNHETDEAVQHYNNVLYTSAPAHTCAFLNRSMAWIESGYYELAVMDVYRACRTANELKQVRNVEATTHPFTTSVRALTLSADFRGPDYT